MRKIIFQAPCGFNKIDLAPLALVASEYAQSIGAEFLLLDDRAPRVIAPAWSQAFAMRDALRISMLGDVLCWLAPISRVVTEEDIFSVLADDDWLRTAFTNKHPHPRSVWIRNCSAAERFVDRLVYHAKPGRSFFDEFSYAAATEALPAPGEWVGSLNDWRANPNLPEPRVLSATGATHVGEIEAILAILPSAIEAARHAPRAIVPVGVAAAKEAPPPAPKKPTVERPEVRMRGYGPR